MKFIIKDMRPLATVEGSGFKKLIASVDPRLTVKHRSTYTREKLPVIYEGRK
jgi:hypothetical protein